MLKSLKRIVKQLLSIPAVRKVYIGVNRLTLNVAASSRVLATLYSFPAFLTFNREQYAVLKGRRNYYRNLEKQRNTHVELRRNIHRLEKGIIMQPRKDVFARDYIGETIEFYEAAAKQAVNDPQSLDETEMQWAHDVLARYFSIVTTGDSYVDDARDRFESTRSIYDPKAQKEKAPFLRKERVKSSVTYEDMMDLAMQRRSIRWFKQKKVPRELIDKAILIGRQAPTACNRLPYEYRIFDEPELVKKVAGIPFGAAGYAHQIPTIIVVVGKLDSYFSPRDRHAIYIDASLAAMSFMYGLETLGLSSSVINWPDFEPLEMKMQKTLNLATSDRVVMMIAVGYADESGGIPFSQKKSLDVLRSYNQIEMK